MLNIPLLCAPLKIAWMVVVLDPINVIDNRELVRVRNPSQGDKSVREGCAPVRRSKPDVSPFARSLRNDALANCPHGAVASGNAPFYGADSAMIRRLQHSDIAGDIAPQLADERLQRGLGVQDDFAHARAFPLS